MGDGNEARRMEELGFLSKRTELKKGMDENRLEMGVEVSGDHDKEKYCLFETKEMLEKSGPSEGMVWEVGSNGVFTYGLGLEANQGLGLS